MPGRQTRPITGGGGTPPHPRLLPGRRHLTHIFVPGKGLVSADIVAVDRAVREYDERLAFDINPKTGLPTIFIRQPPSFDWGELVFMEGGNHYPVLAFPDGIPSPDRALRRLYETDAQRQGHKMLDRLHRNNERIKAEKDDAAQEATGTLVEAVESYAHDQGATKYRRVYRPTKKTGIRVP